VGRQICTAFVNIEVGLPLMRAMHSRISIVEDSVCRLCCGSKFRWYRKESLLSSAISLFSTMMSKEDKHVRVSNCYQANSQQAKKEALVYQC
jgi:hypothetical protein